MNCNKCGFLLTPGIQVCPNCGQPVQNINNNQNMNYGNLNQMPNNYNNQVQNNYNNQMPYNQPNYYNNQPLGNNNMPMNNQPMGTNNSKGNNTLFFIIIAVIVIILIGIVAFSMVIHKNDDMQQEKGQESNDVTESSNIEDSNINSNLNSNSNIVSNNNNSNKPTSSVTYRTLTINGYSFQVSSNYASNIVPTGNADVDGLQLMNAKTGSRLMIAITPGKYSDLKASQSSIKSMMQQQGVTVKTVQIKVFSGKEFITGEVLQNGRSLLMGFSQLDSNHVYTLILYNTRYTIDYNLFNEVVPILKTAKKVG